MTRRRFARDLLAVVVSVGSFCRLGSVNSQHAASPRRIGVLFVAFSLDGMEAQEFRHGLQEAGYTEGRDVLIEWRSANGDYDRLEELVADLVRRKVDVIVTDSTPGGHAVKHATSTIPVVMAVVGDPVGSGLVPSLAHPGGNITGFSVMAAALSAKRLQLLKETIPHLTRVAILLNPATRWHLKAVDDLKVVAPSLSIDLTFANLQTPEQFNSAFSAITRAHAQALCVLDDAQFVVHRRTLIKLASTARLPDIYGERHFADEGGLMSYGANYPEHWRRAAAYVDKILKGAKPGDLPVEQPNKFVLVVNLKTAKALGITIPESILLRADEVIR